MQPIPTPLAAHNCWPLCLWLSGRFRGSDPIWRWQPGGRSLWYNTTRAPLITRRKHKQTDKRSPHSSFSMQHRGWASFTPVTACYQRKQFLRRWLFLHNPACRVIVWPCFFSLDLFKSPTVLWNNGLFTSLRVNSNSSKLAKAILYDNMISFILKNIYGDWLSNCDLQWLEYITEIEHLNHKGAIEVICVFFKSKVALTTANTNWQYCITLWQ